MDESSYEKHGFTVAIGLENNLITLEPGDIQQLYFIEDIFSFCINGKIIFEDRYGIFEGGPFTGNERLMVLYGEKSVRKILFDIIKIEKITMGSPSISSKGLQLVVYFVDTTFRYMTKIRYSRSWKDKKSFEILEHIIHKWCEGEGDNEKILLKRYDPSDNMFDFLSPYWTPMECIMWLNRRTNPAPSENIGEEVGGYLYYNNTYWDDGETKNKDNNFTAAWKSINALFSYPVTKNDKWIDTNTFTFSGGMTGADDDSPTYVNKILDWNYNGIDFISTKKLMGGRMVSYKFDGKLLINRDYKYTKMNDEQNVKMGMIDNITLLGEKSLFPDISHRDADITMCGTTRGWTIDNMYYNDWLRNYVKQQTLSVIVRGWEGRFAGQLVKELYWESFDSEEKGGNKNLIGPYVVKSVTHNFGTKQGYTQRLVLMKNSYYKSDNTSLVPAFFTNISSDGSILKP